MEGKTLANLKLQVSSTLSRYNEFQKDPEDPTCWVLSEENLKSGSSFGSPSRDKEEDEFNDQGPKSYPNLTQEAQSIMRGIQTRQQSVPEPFGGPLVVLSHEELDEVEGFFFLASSLDHGQTLPESLRLQDLTGKVYFFH